MNPDKEWVLGKFWLALGALMFLGGSACWIVGVWT